MISPRPLRITITDAYGKTETLVAEGARLLFGSAAHCDVRVHSPGVAREHILLETTGDIVVALVHRSLPCAFIEGAPFRSARLVPGARLAFAGVTMTIAPVALPAKRTTGGRLRTIGIAAAMLCLAPAAAFGAVKASAKSPEIVAPEPPALASTELPACSVEPQGAMGAAVTSARAGAMARERYPFAPEDGARALGDFSRAEACFIKAGRANLAQGTHDVSVSLASRLSHDVHVHHARLLHSLDTNDIAGARRETVALKALMHGRHDAYSDWLDTVDRRVEVVRAKDTAKRTRHGSSGSSSSGSSRAGSGGSAPSTFFR